MPGQIVKCEATDCLHNNGTYCSTDHIWITHQHKCESYEAPDDPPEPSFIGPVED